MAEDETAGSGGPGRAKTYHHGDLKAALIAAAAAILERDGPEAISLRAVARAAGVSQTAPYNHFPSKEDLLAALAGSGFAGLAASQRAAAEASPPGEARIVALGLDYVGFALKRPQLYRLMYGVGVSDWCGHPAVVEAKAESFRPIREALAADPGGDGAAIETAAISAWALVHGLSMLILDRSLAPAGAEEGEPGAQVGAVLAAFAAGLKRGA